MPERRRHPSPHQRRPQAKGHRRAHNSGKKWADSDILSMLQGMIKQSARNRIKIFRDNKRDDLAD
jgi:uncharacterized protein YqeY